MRTLDLRCEAENAFYLAINKPTTFWHVDEEFKYCVKVSAVGSISLKFKLHENEKQDTNKRFYIVTPDEPALDVFFVDFGTNRTNAIYSEEAIRKYLLKTNYNSAHYDIKYINIWDLFNKVVSHPNVKANDIDYKLSISMSRPELYFNIASNGYNYCSTVNVPKKLYSIDRIKLFTSELFDEASLFFSSHNKINDIERFMFQYGFYTNISKIDKYNLKSFITFYNNFNKTNIEQYLKDNIDRDSINRLLTLTQKVEKSIHGRQIDKINITIKGIKIYCYHRKATNKAVFEIPLFRLYTFESKEVDFLYAYLASLDEFDSLTYKFERIYLSSL